MAQGLIQSPIARCDPLATIGPVAAALLRGPPVPYPFFALGEAPTISVGLVPALPCATLQANARAVRALCRHLPISLRHHGLCTPSWGSPLAVPLTCCTWPAWGACDASEGASCAGGDSAFIASDMFMMIVSRR